MRTKLALFAFWAAPLAAAAEGFDLAVYAGPSFPTYSQSFRYDVGPIALPLAEVRLEQIGDFGLDASGGISLGASLSRRLAGPLAVEARLDTAAIDVDSAAGRFRLSARLPAPFGAVSQEIEVPGAVFAIERPRPFSLNLKLVAPGPAALFASGGLSYLPALRLRARQDLRAATGGGVPLPIALPAVAVAAEAAPGEDESSWGWNAGAGARIPIGKRVGLVLEARGFIFPERTLRWSRVDEGPLGAAEEAVVEEIERRLEPVRFKPTFFQATAGLSLAF